MSREDDLLFKLKNCVGSIANKTTNSHNLPPTNHLRAAQQQLTTSRTPDSFTNTAVPRRTDPIGRGGDPVGRTIDPIGRGIDHMERGIEPVGRGLDAVAAARRPSLTMDGPKQNIYKADPSKDLYTNYTSMQNRSTLEQRVNRNVEKVIPPKTDSISYKDIAARRQSLAVEPAKRSIAAHPSHISMKQQIRQRYSSQKPAITEEENIKPAQFNTAHKYTALGLDRNRQNSQPAGSLTTRKINQQAKSTNGHYEEAIHSRRQTGLNARTARGSSFVVEKGGSIFGGEKAAQSRTESEFRGDCSAMQKLKKISELNAKINERIRNIITVFEEHKC